MTEAEAALLASLPAYAFGFVLVLGRVGGAMMLLPGVGEAELPVILRAGLALAFDILLLPTLMQRLPHLPADVAPCAAMVVAEVVTGVWLGWLARLTVQALPLAGQIISYMLGLASVLQPDPALGGQSTALARLFSLAAPVMLLASGAYMLPLGALAGSYELIGPGSLLPATDATETLVRVLTRAFALALQLAAPFVLLSLVWQVMMGLLARMVPRLQVYFAAQPAQILGGLALLGAIGAMLLSAWLQAVRDSFGHLPGM
ncbi:MAG: flagellar biosynthetic protein FliR [Acetobacteraceae bacterium]|nr:flagellar biosynthetic protein FliR [Acetobacteraceae bacterium]